MRLIRLLVTLAIIGGLGYLAVTLSLGGKTLWQHLRAIASSKESQDLVQGVKQKAREIIQADGGGATAETTAERADGGSRGTAPGQNADAAHGSFSEQERQLLRQLIREKLAREKRQRAEHKQH